MSPLQGEGRGFEPLSAHYKAPEDCAPQVVEILEQRSLSELSDSRLPPLVEALRLRRTKAYLLAGRSGRRRDRRSCTTRAAPAATTITPPSVAATSRATPSGSCPWKNRNETATVCRFCRIKTSTRISEATKTTTAVHTVLVRVRGRSGSAGARGDPSIGDASEEGCASVRSLSSCDPMLDSPYPAGPGARPPPLRSVLPSCSRVFPLTRHRASRREQREVSEAADTEPLGE